MADTAYLSLDNRFHQLHVSERSPATAEDEQKQPAPLISPYGPPPSHPQHSESKSPSPVFPSASAAGFALPASSLPLPAMARLFHGSQWLPEKRLGPPCVEIEGLSKSYTLPGRAEVVQALRCIDLRSDGGFYPILRGEFVMIRGPSGGGKTTLLNILGTIDEPTSGTVSLLGERVDASSSDSYLAALRLRKVGFVFQTFNLLATMSAFENVELPMTILGERSARECKERAMALLDLVGLQDRYGHLPSELSGGEQQRVTIARALSNEPELLLLDEPTGDLDTRSTIDVMDLILRVNQEQGTTCVMVTHNPDLECRHHNTTTVQHSTARREDDVAVR